VNQTVLQWLTKCLTPWKVDNSFGTMESDSENGPKLATYVRYNALLDEVWLQRNADIQSSPAEVVALGRMDTVAHIDRLSQIGSKCAGRQISDEHFPAAFDP
jgi:hypothetical protein